MAIKTSVNGNRVTIDDSVYVVKPAGQSRHSVYDDFGGNLGSFTIRGKAIEPDDYGVEGAHPIVQIARLWTAVNLAKADEKPAAPQSKMVCRLMTHGRPTEPEAQKAKAYHAWLKDQPGFKSAYLAQDPAGKTLSVSIWESKEHLEALKTQAPPEGAALPKATSVEVLQLFEDV